MNAPEVKRLIDQVPSSVRHAVLDSGEFQNMASDFVRAHVQARANELVDRLRQTEGFEEELEKLDPRPDFVEACAENDIEIVEDDGAFYSFNWQELSTIEVGTDGKGYIDFPQFAQDKGLDLSLWAWSVVEHAPVLRSSINDENATDIDSGRSVLAGVIEATALVDASEVVDALAHIARESGKNDLALALQDAGKRKDLLEGYVCPNSVLSADEFPTKEEAAEHACRVHNIEAYYPEVYEYWVVDDTLAYLLQEQGELVERDFVGFTIWGRCATGQSISLDGVISNIMRERFADEIDALVLQQFPNVGKHDEHLLGVPVDALKALEEDRVVCVSYTYSARGYERTDSADVVISAADPTLGWKMQTLGRGIKDGSNPDSPVPVAQIEDRFRSWGEPAGAGLVSRPPTQEEIDELVHQIDHFHQVNRSSVMHKVPENLQERLAKLSPAYAATLAASNSGPSLG